MNELLSNPVVLILGAILGFLIVRYIITWFFKLNSLEDKLRRNNELLEILVSEKESDYEQKIKENRKRKKWYNKLWSNFGF